MSFSFLPSATEAAVMFSQVSFILFRGAGRHGRGHAWNGVFMAGGGMRGWGPHMAGAMHGRMDAWQGACVAGEVCVAGEPAL